MAGFWTLDEQRAHWQGQPLSASIDLTRPQHGLSHVGFREAQFSGARVLAIATARSTGDPCVTLGEHYVRGADVVAVYGESAHNPLRVDAMWRHVSSCSAEPLPIAFDLIVSVRTQLLDVRPEIGVETYLPADEVLRLTGQGDLTLQTLPSPGQPPIVLQPGDGPACSLFRLPGSEVSYIEMVHPDDLCHEEFAAGQGDRVACLRHVLFAGRLEKGVLLRARVRGVFLPRQRDRSLAVQCYQAFAAGEPPMDTY